MLALLAAGALVFGFMAAICHVRVSDPQALKEMLGGYERRMNARASADGYAGLLPVTSVGKEYARIQKAVAQPGFYWPAECDTLPLDEVSPDFLKLQQLLAKLSEYALTLRPRQALECQLLALRIPLRLSGSSSWAGQNSSNRLVVQACEGWMRLLGERRFRPDEYRWVLAQLGQLDPGLDGLAPAFEMGASVGLIDVQLVQSFDKCWPVWREFYHRREHNLTANRYLHQWQGRPPEDPPALGSWDSEVQFPEAEAAVLRREFRQALTCREAVRVVVTAQLEWAEKGTYPAAVEGTNWMAADRRFVYELTATGFRLASKAGAKEWPGVLYPVGSEARAVRGGAS